MLALKYEDSREDSFHHHYNPAGHGRRGAVVSWRKFASEVPGLKWKGVKPRGIKAAVCESYGMYSNLCVHERICQERTHNLRGGENVSSRNRSVIWLLNTVRLSPTENPSSSYEVIL